MEKPLLLCPEVAQTLNVTTATVQKWCRDHRIGHRVGGRWRVSSQAVDLIAHGTPLPEVASRVQAA
jgi:excisionase family DNA binding protein